MYKDLIKKAKQKIGKKKLTGDVNIGHVGCALETKDGNIFTGISIKAKSGLDLCAEVVAMSQMVESGETEVKTLVGISHAGKIIPPCGRCREFMYQLNRKNIKTEIVITEDTTLLLEDLLPHRWQDYWGKED